jgi:hypothetical protein
MSSSTWTSNWVGNYFYCGNPEEHIQNYCAQEARRNPDGSVDGEVIFVRSDCETRLPLDMEHQDPIYQKPGVPMDRGQLQGILTTFGDNGPDKNPAPGGCKKRSIQC